MKFFEKLFNKSYNSKYNFTLIISGIFSIVFLVVFLVGISFIQFTEVYKGITTLVPNKETVISLRFDSYVKKNYVEIGKRYKKGDTLLELDKTFINNAINNLKNDIKYLYEKQKISRSVLSQIEIKEINKTIIELKSQIENLKINLSEVFIKAPFDCILLSSDYSEVEIAFLKKGTNLCKIMSLNNPYFKFEIKKYMIGKIEKGQQAVIKLKKDRLKINGEIDKIEIGKNNSKYVQYAYVKIDNSNIIDIGMDAEIDIIMNKISIKDFVFQAFGIYK